MTYEKILYSLDGGVARIALNDPATLNAGSETMGRELVAALDRASHEARAILLTGEGKGFCSGANLSDAKAMLDDPMRDVGALLDIAFNRVIVAMKNSPLPIVTAVRGPAAGVGCGIATAGDIIVCGEGSYFLQAFRNVGLVSDGGSSWLLSRAIGRVRALQMMLLGERIYGQQALDWGLVTKLVPDDEVESAAMEIAQGLATGPASLALIKRNAWAAEDASLETAMQNERLAQRDASRTEDFVEGVTAFGAKRKPEFKGR